MARVLFTSCPAYGHALPMLPLVRAATAAGHAVRLATGPDLVAPLASRGLEVHGVGPPWTEAWAAHDAVWADPGRTEQQKMMDGVVALFGTPALGRLADLTTLAEEWRPDLVVHEVLEVAGPLLARRLGVRGVVHGFGPMFPFYADLVAPAGAAIGEPGLWDAVSAETALDICPPSLRPEGPPPWPDARPLRPTAGEPGPLLAEVAEVLAGDRPLAYFTLGTVKNTEVADFAAALEALESYDGAVVATTGRRTEPGELGPVPPNVVLAEFVPQASVLPVADLVVSHSGSGTMLGALAYGVPQVALPRGTDQPQNAALLARTGAGVVVEPEDYAVDTIAAAIAEVTTHASYRAAAERVRDEVTAMPTAEEVWPELLS